MHQLLAKITCLLTMEFLCHVWYVQRELTFSSKPGVVFSFKIQILNSASLYVSWHQNKNVFDRFVLLVISQPYWLIEMDCGQLDLLGWIKPWVVHPPMNAAHLWCRSRWYCHQLPEAYGSRFGRFGLCLWICCNCLLLHCGWRMSIWNLLWTNVLIGKLSSNHGNFSKKSKNLNRSCFFSQTQPNPMGGNPFSTIPTEANPSAPQSFKLCNTWMAEMCLWSPWIHLGDLVAQDAKNQNGKISGKKGMFTWVF